MELRERANESRAARTALRKARTTHADAYEPMSAVTPKKAMEFYYDVFQEWRACNEDEDLDTSDLLNRVCDEFSSRIGPDKRFTSFDSFAAELERAIENAPSDS